MMSSDDDGAALLPRLHGVLDALGPLALAVSGGIDSLVLAWVAHRHAAAPVTVFHALSPAVPAAATDRVVQHARQEGWRVELINAGEFGNPDYRANPVDRCFHCKSHLYAAIGERSADQIASGTNLDDLGDYRPGLQAAREHQVRHPYVEAGLRKADVRRLARALGLADLAELPPSPCLASRIETGIRIEPQDLGFIDGVESLLRHRFADGPVRLRRRHDGPVIELDADALAQVQSDSARPLREQLERLCRARGLPAPRYELYRRGSAFLRS